MVRNILSVAVLALLLGGVANVQVSAAPITPAVEYASTGIDVDERAFTLGYEFTTSVQLTVNALAYWDDGQQTSHQVGIWTAGGALVVSTTVLGSDTLVGHFIYHTVANTVLAPGTYVIGGEFGDPDPSTFADLPTNAIGVTTISGFTWNTARQLEGSGLNFPTDTQNTYGQNGILAVNFSVGDAAVPEPASLALLGLGLAGLGFSRRRKT